MGAAQEQHVPVTTVDVELGSPDWKLRTKLTVPSGPTRLIELLPLVNALSDAVVNVGIKSVEERGEKISCKKGCGACCRQLVPISEVEARRMREVLDALPEPRRSEVRTRFAAARQRLDQAGLVEPLEHRETWHNEDFQAQGLKYFRLGIPCPFLEDESCSIYADRPVTCREYLVTSPAEHCANPSREKVLCVKFPLKVLPGLTRFDPVPPTALYVRWVPLVLAPAWAETHADTAPPRPGPELLRELFDHLADKERDNLQPATPAMGTSESDGEPTEA